MCLVGNTQCQDHRIRPQKVWVDWMHFNCSLYEGAKWCTNTGDYGKGWNWFWGNFNGYENEGMNATKACCGCGGGITKPPFDDVIPMYSGVAEYPYADVSHQFNIIFTTN